MSQLLPNSVITLANQLKENEFETIDLDPIGSWPETVHRLDKTSLLAIITAVSAGRPLLVRGEPGIGKSHFARAAAKVLGRHFMSEVIQPGADYQDLLWTLDYTARLGDAQLLAHGGRSLSDKSAADKSAADESAPDKPVSAAEQLPIKDYLSPGPLWWAFDWGDAKSRSRCDASYLPEEEGGVKAEQDGVVLLIDEIDKADIALANGLLEVLGNGSFSVPIIGQSVRGDKPPLVVITSNDSRELPQAFVRRCVLLNLSLPTDGTLLDHLVGVGQLHFPELPRTIVTQAAKFVVDARSKAAEDSMVKTGQAELIDLLRSLDALNKQQSDADLEGYCNMLSQFFRK